MPELKAPCESGVCWRADIDSLAFTPTGHRGQCVIHRHAFRTLLGMDATAQQCIEYFEELRPAFELAAADKIRRAKLTVDANFHINSRDVRRSTPSTATTQQGEKKEIIPQQ